MRVLIGPYDRSSSHARHVLEAFRREGRHELACFSERDGDITLPFHARPFTDLLAALPSGWEPDLVVFYNFEYQGLPRGIEESPYPVVGVLGDWNLAFDAARGVLGCFDLVLTDRPGAEILRQLGHTHVQALPIFAFDPTLHRRLPGIARTTDIAFIGNFNHTVQRRRAAALKRVARLSDRYRVELLTGVFGEAYVQAFNRARIVFNQSIRGEINMRVYEAMACGALVFYEADNPEVRELFTDRVHCVLYTDETLEELLEYYLAHEQERAAIAEAGWQEVQGYTYAGQLRRILQRAEAAGLLDHPPRRPRPFARLPDVTRHLARSTQALQAVTSGSVAVMAEELERARALAPADPRVLNDQAVVVSLAALQGPEASRPARLAEAEQGFAQAVQLAPGYLLARLNLALARVARGATAEAEGTLDELWSALAAGAQAPAAFEGLGFPAGYDVLKVERERAASSYAGDPEGFVREMRALVRWRVAELRGDLAYARADWEGSADAYREAAAACPALGSARVKLARTLCPLGRFAEAEAELRAGIEAEPFDRQAWAELAELLWEQRRYGEVVAFADDCLAVLRACPAYGDAIPGFEALRRSASRQAALADRTCPVARGGATPGPTRPWPPEPGCPLTVLYLCGSPMWAHIYGIRNGLRALGHRVLTAAAPHPEGHGFYDSIMAALKRQDPEFAYDIVCEEDAPLEAILARCPAPPDLILYVENGAPFLPEGLAASPVPTVGLLTEDLVHADWEPDLFPFFDLALTGYARALRAYHDRGHDNLAYWYFGGCDTYHCDHGLPRIHDVVLLGGFTPMHRQRARDLEQVLRLQAEGVRLHVGYGAYFDEYARLHSQAKIVFNRSLLDLVNMRVLEAMGSGCLVVTNLPADLDDPCAHFFRDREHVVFYRDAAEAVELIRYYLAHDAERERIARAGHDRVHGALTYARAARGLLEELLPRIPPDYRQQRQARLRRHGLDPGRERRSRGKYFYLHESPGAARRAYQQGPGVHRDPEVQMGLGACLARAGHGEVALPHLQRALALTPGSPLARFDLAMILATARQPGTGAAPALAAVHDALACLQPDQVSGVPAESLEGPYFPPAYDPFRLALSRAYFAHPPGPARAAALATLYRARLWRQAGALLLELQRPAEAVEALEAAVAEIPEDGYAAGELAVALHHAGRSAEALDWLARAVALEPFYSQAQFNLAALLQLSGQLEKARHRYEESLRWNPLFGPFRLAALKNLGLLHREQGRRADARTCWEEALSVDGTQEEIRTLLDSLREETAAMATGVPDPTAPTEGQRFSLYHTDGKGEALKAWMAPYADVFKGAGRVLDIGCGPGHFLELLHERGVTGIGIDTDPAMVEACRARGFEAHVLAAEAVGAHLGCFDGVHAGHILEHMPGPQALRFLEACATLLNPGGLLVIRTPNWENETVRNGGFWLDWTHVRPYPLALLEKAFADLGLEVAGKGVEPGGWNDLYIVGRRMAGRQKAPSSGAVRRSPQARGVAASRPEHAVSPPEPGTPVRVTWEGGQLVQHSLALVNRELSLALLQGGRCALTVLHPEPPAFGPEADPERLAPLVARIRPQAPADTEVHVRHRWPPEFTPPPHGRWVMIQPWEYGSLPAAWVRPMRELVDELWVPSRYVRDCYIASGVPADKVVVVPNGVDVSRFHPQAPPLSLPTQKRFRFLFVGGTIWRKGADLLLEAFARAFCRTDDVCLVIKEFGAQSFYQNQGMGETIRALQATPEAPEILYMTEAIGLQAMPGLYTACHCLVHPYRGEGFALPIAEAMACALPVIVTGAGACREFCDEETARLLPARRVTFPERRVGELETVDHPWVYEVDMDALAGQMQAVVQEYEAARAMGARAMARIRSAFTWAHAAARAQERLEALRGRPVLREARERRRSAEAFNRRGLAYVEQGKTDKAVRALHKAMEADATFAEPCNNLGVVEWQRGRRAEALALFRKALALDPGDADAQHNLAACAQELEPLAAGSAAPGGGRG